MKHELDPYRSLAWLARRLAIPLPELRSAPLHGQLGERQLRARAFPSGLTVALVIDKPLQQASAVCLLLAATPEAADDTLYINEGRLWLLRRYPALLLDIELDLLLKQQQALAALLSQDPLPDVAPLPMDGRYA
ncbi:protein EsaB [Chitinimonas sp. BJB300]|uniref:protein EsaB n=1 Tax=Chitinimonas sp. BJB300 TaxID=1559339 RepID=UPI000C11B4C2|nr:protein EsaB [Chitinimonas sp. BJB300]PHV11491.1 protein EsaB [Chitinimonas sp. BJB300]TSJ88513.1 protein EsaB [Chitinimonas sp. BJB300]